MKFPKSKSVNGHIMNRAVLVLNANYSPMTICSAKRAICMEFLNKVEVLASYEDIVRSPSISVNLPSIIKSSPMTFSLCFATRTTKDSFIFANLLRKIKQKFIESSIKVDFFSKYYLSCMKKE